MYSFELIMCFAKFIFFPFVHFARTNRWNRVKYLPNEQNIRHSFRLSFLSFFNQNKSFSNGIRINNYHSIGKMCISFFIHFNSLKSFKRKSQIGLQYMRVCLSIYGRNAIMLRNLFEQNGFYDACVAFETDVNECVCVWLWNRLQWNAISETYSYVCR